VASEPTTPGSGPPIPPELLRQARVTLRAHEAMDEAWRLIEEVNARQEHPGQVACASGCAACCSYLVDTISSEGAVIATGIEYGDPGYKAVVMERLLDWEYEFMHWMLRHPIPNEGRKDHEHDLWRGQWQIRRIACPFLDLDSNMCSIYADRPATCRGHHACYPPPQVADHVSMPPEGCFTKIEDLQRGELTPIWQLNDTVTQTFSKLLADSLHARDIAFSSHLLPIMVLWAGRSWFGWPAPDSRKRRAKPPRITVARKEPPQ